MIRSRLPALLGAPVLLLLAACSSGANVPAATASSGSSPSPHASASAGSGCVSQSQATQIWTQIDQKLNAIELDPKHAGVAGVATGQAEQLINAYLQQQLVSSDLTEREVDKLQSLTVLDAACNGGQLDLHIAIDLVQDDYLKPNGQIDHPDSQVGKTLHFDEVFVRASGVWKEAAFSSLDQATPTPQLF